MALVENKRNHHILPRKYLEGFVSDTRQDHIWEYKKGQEYAPGFRGTSNPRLISIRKASVQIDMYASVDYKGNIDYNKFENLLERIEKRSDRVLTKLRKHEILSNADKIKLSTYIWMMINRTPKGKQSVERQWYNSKQADEFRFRRGLAERFRNPNVPLEQLIDESKKIDYAFGPKMPSVLWLNVIPFVGSAARSLRRMHWTILVAPESSEFLTCDNPVVFAETLGLKHTNFELIFPVSSEVALLLSWGENPGDRIDSVQPDVVEDINTAILRNASLMAYCSQNQQEIALRMNSI